MPDMGKRFSHHTNRENPLTPEKQTFYAVKQKQFTPNVGHELFNETICFYDDWRGAV